MIFHIKHILEVNHVYYRNKEGFYLAEKLDT